MTIPIRSYTATIIWHEDFEKWFEKVSGKKLEILEDLGREHGHYTYAEFEIRKYNPEDFSETWIEYQDSFMNDDTNTTFSTDIIEGYIEQNNLLPVGKYIILADW